MCLEGCVPRRASAQGVCVCLGGVYPGEGCACLGRSVCPGVGGSVCLRMSAQGE